MRNYIITGSIIIYIISLVGYYKVLYKQRHTNNMWDDKGFEALSFIIGLVPIINTKILILMLLTTDNESNTKGNI